MIALDYVARLNLPEHDDMVLRLHWLTHVSQEQVATTCRETAPFDATLTTLDGVRVT